MGLLPIMMVSWYWWWMMIHIVVGVVVDFFSYIWQICVWNSLNVCFVCVGVFLCVCVYVWYMYFHYSNRNQSTLLVVIGSVPMVVGKMNGLWFTQLISKSPAGGIISDRNGFGRVASKMFCLFVFWFFMCYDFRNLIRP